MSTRRAGLSRFIPLILIFALAIGLIAVPMAYDTYTKSLKPKPSGTIETSISLSPYLTLKIRDQNGGIIYESSQPSHSPTRTFAYVLAQQLGAQYLLAGEAYKYTVYFYYTFPYTLSSNPQWYDTAYFVDNGVYGGVPGYDPGYGTVTLYIVAGKSPYSSFNPDVSWLPAEPGYRIEVAAVAVSMGSNSTHAWVTLASSIQASSDLVVEDVGILFSIDQSNFQYCKSQRDATGRCGFWPTLSAAPLGALIWWDKISQVTVPAGSLLDIAYTFYTAFPCGGNFLSIIFSTLHQPRAGEDYVIYDTSGASYTNYFPEYHFAYVLAGVTYYRWPALRILWGTGSAPQTGPWSPYTLANKIGEGDALIGVSSLPTGGMVISLMGVIWNPTSSSITVTEVGFQLGGVPGIGELCLRNAGNTALGCPARGKSVTIAYLPTSIALRPGEAVQLIFRIAFTSI
jgi:hypothetical protein